MNSRIKVISQIYKVFMYVTVLSSKKNRHLEKDDQQVFENELRDTADKGV